ncbi:MAG TPA: hypothetical protein VJ875_04120 [Pyrinomonadaceae bacterium]|nr:hypothetical protein [Pyrinomonadaceae bacterium]
MASSWAAAFFGLSQIAKLLGNGNSEWTKDALEMVTRSIESELSEEMRMVFQSGDRLQRGLITSMFNLLAGRVDTSRLIAKNVVDLAQCASGTAAMLSPVNEQQLAWQELQNKLETFNLFAHVDLDLDLLRKDASLSEFVARASRLGPYRSVWAIEGVGHFFAELGDTSGRSIKLATEPDTLPSSSLVALHSGAGLSFARRCLETITTRHSEREVRTTLERFIVICNENSHAGYVGAAYEALGLVARNLYPHLLLEIDHHLAALDEELVAYFWHGVGRGVYFAPTNFLLDRKTLRHVMKQAQQESPHELARLNVFSGLIWALVLVNIRHPKIIEGFIADNLDGLDGEIFAGALCSAAAIWRESSPEDKALTAFWKYHPSDHRVAEFWNAYVTEPSRMMLNHYYPAVRNAGLGWLFRHRSLPELFVDRERCE